jgi:hypothetical protein
MDNCGRFHRKKIAKVRTIFSSGKKSCVPIALSVGNVAKKTHRGTNYCSATPVFAETSRISPGV